MRNTSVPAVLLLVMAMGLILAASTPGITAPQAPSVTIVSPKNGAVISGSGVEVKVAFTSTAAQPVTRVQINLDGKSVTEQADESVLSGGDCGFLWDTVRCEDGQHRLDAQIFSGKAYLGMTTCVVTVANKGQAQMEERPMPDIKAPVVKIESPKEGETVSGKVPVIIQAKDDSGKSPFVSVFVDKSLKAVTNHEPYQYTWDSTSAENGPHEIHVAAIDHAENRTVSPPVRIIVRNASKVNPMVNEESVAAATSVSAPRTETPVAPQERSEPTPEAARTAETTPVNFEVSQPAPAEHVASSNAKVEAAPPVPVKIAQLPEPETAVLVSGPAEISFGAEKKSEPAPAATCEPEKEVRAQKCEPVAEPKQDAGPAEPVQVVAARIDQPKKPVSTPMPKVEPKVIEYVVQSGDALSIIARRYGTTVAALVEANGIKDPSLIRVGQKLRVLASADTVMVPLKSAFDAAGGVMMWDGKQHSTHAWAPGTEVRVWIGSARAEVNDQKVVMTRPAALKSGRTMVPQSFVTETLGMSLSAGK